ncbi:MAG: hypothetical protein ACWGMZ_03215 [Thermoguttaceae bacterium]
MSARISESDLEAYIDEALPPEEMAAIERMLREDRKLLDRLAAIHARRDSGVHSIGEIWREHRLSCPTRAQLGAFLLHTLPQETANYVAFHLQVVGCRYCAANLADLQAVEDADQNATESRRRKYFQSSTGYLPRAR